MLAVAWLSLNSAAAVGAVGRRRYALWNTAATRSAFTLAPTEMRSVGAITVVRWPAAQRQRTRDDVALISSSSY